MFIGGHVWRLTATDELSLPASNSCASCMQTILTPLIRSLAHAITTSSLGLKYRIWTSKSDSGGWGFLSMAPLNLKTCKFKRPIICVLYTWWVRNRKIGTYIPKVEEGESKAYISQWVGHVILKLLPLPLGLGFTFFFHEKELILVTE